jgi:Secretion system C-terminal sorting domain
LFYIFFIEYLHFFNFLICFMQKSIFLFLAFFMCTMLYSNVALAQCDINGEVCFIRTDYAGQEPSPFDIRDDQFQFLFKVTGATGDGYQVFVGDRLYIESAPGQSYWFRFPIGNGSPISMRVVQKGGCSKTVMVTPPARNRSIVPCNASAYITGISCDPLSTRDYPGDDKFTFDVQAYDGSMFGDQNYEVYVTSYTQEFYNFYYSGGSEGTNWGNWRGGWRNVGSAAYGSKMNVGKHYIRDFGAGTKLAVVVARKGDAGCFRLYTLEVPQPCSLNPWRKAGAATDIVESMQQTFRTLDAISSQKIATSTNLTSNHTLSIYPNPAHERVMVETAGWNGEVVARIMNAEGKMIQQVVVDGNSRNELNISNLVPGMYFLHLNNGAATKSEKFIVK